MTKMELKGTKELENSLKLMPVNVAKRVAKKGLRQAGTKLAREFRKAAPKGQTGRLKKSIGVKTQRDGTVKVGVNKKVQGKIPFYYKTLEFGRRANPKQAGNKPPLSPFFGKVWRRMRRNVAKQIVQSTKEAVAFEAGKASARPARFKNG